jgi:hypothetical protein
MNSVHSISPSPGIELNKKTNQVELGNYGTQPVLLKSVEATRK